MGGGGSWCLGANMNMVWAGIGPMSGWYKPTPAPDPQRYLGLPIFCIHGDQDRAVPVQLSRMAQKELAQLKHKDFEYVELAGVGHPIFLKVEGMAACGKMFDWMLEKKRKKPADLESAEKELATWGRLYGWTPEGGLVGSYVKK